MEPSVPLVSAVHIPLKSYAVHTPFGALLADCLLIRLQSVLCVTPERRRARETSARARFGPEGTILEPALKNKKNRARTHSPGRSFHHWITHDKTASNTPHGAASQHRILCVDDEIEGTRMRGQILEKKGYSVVLHHCPLAALRSDLSMFSLAIVDFEMPELNGRELLLRMRAQGAKFPIVLLAGSVDSLSHDDRVLFARCIDKGTSIRCLLETVAEFLGLDQISDFSA
jgi:CheY-like chemotaxis protein